jgi:rhamnogalacturonyl hydrolase YesR
MIRIFARAGSRLPLAVASILVACRAPSTRVRPDVDSFREWPANARPDVIGRRVTENYLARPFGFEIGRVPYVVYQEAVTWYGALDFAAAAKDDALAARLARKFDPFLTADGARRISPENHVDFDVFGAVPLSLYRSTRDARYMNAGRPLADREWAVPPDAAPGVRPIAARFWVDDLYMLPTVQLEAYRATNDATYLDRTANLVVAYLDSLERDNGLFYHGTDAPYFWGRGNGWAAAGLTELLSALPARHPRRARVLAGYTRMMAALLRYQGPDGLWRELIDHADAWPETSSSAMFTFAFVTGVKHGWLDATTYAPAARRAWLGLVGYLDADGNLANVCTGTGKWQPEAGDGVRYYLDRPRLSGASFSTYEELHGLAPMLWTAAALLR